jgi:3-hydroxy-3-methylglutaryl CoA synthase
MAGIISYGVYVPKLRLSRKTISSAMGWLTPVSLPGEKAIANYDEDSLTMAVAASRNCLEVESANRIDGIYFATTTAPYRERQSATIIATVLGIDGTLRTVDFSQSLRAGTSALLLGAETVESRGAERVLVCASDCRLGKPGSQQEMIFGDGGVAFLVGNDEVIATLSGFHNVSYDFPDHWRAASDKFDRTLENRWIRDEGFTKSIHEAVTGLLKKYELQIKDVSKVIYSCSNIKDHAVIGKKLGFKAHQIQDELITSIGDAGSASVLMMLTAALDEAKPGDNIIVASYGNGSEALWLKTTERIEEKKTKKRIREYFSTKEEMISYEQYLAFTGTMPVETGMRGEVGTTRLQTAWRERKAILALLGSVCKRCGTPQYPSQRICVNPECRCIDEMDDYSFSNKKGFLFSFTEDWLAFSLSPPQMYGLIDFEGGGRYVFDIADCGPGRLKVGLPMEMTFRRKYSDEIRGIYGYFWKAKPS